jgi:hypothetical protein
MRAGCPASDTFNSQQSLMESNWQADEQLAWMNIASLLFNSFIMCQVRPAEWVWMLAAGVGHSSRCLDGATAAPV